MRNHWLKGTYFASLFFHQFLFDEGTTDSSSSEEDGPTTIPETPETIPETPETPQNTIESEDIGQDEECGGEDVHGTDTREQPDEESHGETLKNDNDRNVVDRYAEGGDYWVYYGLSMYDPPSAWEEREREWREENESI
jgi:hypothetical protein